MNKLTEKVGDGATTYITGNATHYAPLEDLEADWEALTPSMAAVVAPDDGGADTVVYILYCDIASDIDGEGSGGLLGEADSPDVVDNVIQGDSATMAITFTLTQS